MLLMIYDPEEKKEEAGINCQKSHEKTPKNRTVAKLETRAAKICWKMGKTVGSPSCYKVNHTRHTSAGFSDHHSSLYNPVASLV